jgi:predicted transcriptional regulator
MLNQHKILRVFQLISLLQQEPPKSTQHLGSILVNTHRTIYRHLDLLRELGFDLQRVHNNKNFITLYANLQAEWNLVQKVNNCLLNGLVNILKKMM